MSGRLSSQEVDGWQKRKPVLDVANVKLDVPAETSFTIAVKEHPSSPASELSGVYFQLKDEGQPLAPVMSSDDNQAQVCLSVILNCEQKLNMTLFTNLM